ncbi:hypothetical protein GJ496_000090 [Pomphorhynchus laevis]|nr:hypothetical protein GJ496_000090 [Pomphorhynchus laevis]
MLLCWSCRLEREREMSDDKAEPDKAEKKDDGYNYQTQFIPYSFTINNMQLMNKMNVDEQAEKDDEEKFENYA